MKIKAEMAAIPSTILGGKLGAIWFEFKEIFDSLLRKLILAWFILSFPGVVNSVHLPDCRGRTEHHGHPWAEVLFASGYKNHLAT